jgi:hypothetical protein
MGKKEEVNITDSSQVVKARQSLAARDLDGHFKGI